MRLKSGWMQAVELPTDYGLSPSYPNPFNPTTTIRFALPEESRVELAVYDVIGRHVRTLANGTLAAGYYDAVFDADGLPSGLYLARLSTPSGTFVQKMMLLK